MKDCVWKPLRDAGLIAKIYGHDVKDPAVQNLMLWCLLHASGASTFGNVSGASARRGGNATPSALETVLAILRVCGLPSRLVVCSFIRFLTFSKVPHTHLIGFLGIFIRSGDWWRSSRNYGHTSRRRRIYCLAKESSRRGVYFFWI